MTVKLIWKCNIMNNYKNLDIGTVKNASTMNVMNLSEDQWTALKGFSKSTSYGDNCQFFNDEAGLRGADKRITLNGAALRATTDIDTQVIGKIPSGAMKDKLVILSGSVLKKAGVVAPAVGGAVSVARTDL